MNKLNALKQNRLFQYLKTLCLSLILAIGIVLSYNNVAQAAVDTTSAATRNDAKQINQRKEDAPHYPNWYEDQRSLESYMDKAGVKSSDRGDSPTDQNNDRGYNPIRQDRVNGYYQDRDENQNSGLIDRSRERLSEATDNVRGTLSPNSKSDGRDYSRAYDRSDASAKDIGDRAGNRIERAKEVFQGATEQAAKGNTPIIQGGSNR